MSFWEELKRRNVVRVGVAYLAVTWLILQVAELILSSFEAPAWVSQALILASALGFPLALVLGWFYELTPEGIKAASQTKGVETVKFTGRKLDFVIIGILVLAVGFLIVDTEVIDEQLLVPPNSVAVLAFEDLSPGGDQEWFSDGLSEEIINSLTQLPELQVTSRSSSFFFKNRNVPLPEITKMLGVAHVIEGSVRRVGEEVRINAQLIDARDGSHLWADRFDGELSDVFALQDQVTARIVEAMAIKLDFPTESVVPRHGNPDALEFYWKGHSALSKLNWREAAVLGPEALQNLEAANQLAPDNSRTLASLSATVSPGKARVPVSSSYKMQPNAQISDRQSTSPPRTCSGLIYPGVPRIIPVRVSATDTVGTSSPYSPASDCL